MINKCHLGFVIAAVCSGTLRGQIIPEGHSSPLPGNHVMIPSSLGTRVGTNLFHGFTEFSIPKGQSATFTASPNLSISNVISRVSGGVPTKIEGTLRSNIPGANLFLMNPSGVFFGAGAKLDISGAFVATTADFIDLGKDGGRVFAVPLGGDSTLSSAAPSAFGFLSNSVSPIEVADTRLEALRESTGLAARTVALIGGEISIKGGGAVLAGDSVIVSVGGAGLVRFDAGDLHSVPSLEGFDSLGAISLSGSLITASADSGEIGGIDMIGRSLTLDNAKIISRNGDWVRGKPIRLAISDDLTMTNSSEIVTTSFPDAGASADVFIEAGSLTMDALGGMIVSEVLTDSSAGSIHMNVLNEIRIGGSSSIFSTVGPDGVAPGGSIVITAGNLRIDGENSTFHSGVRSQTGAIHANGRGGDVRLSISENIFVTRQGSIDAITEPGSLAGSGSINIDSGSVILDGGEFPDGVRPRVTGINSTTSGGGNAGRISVKTDSLSIGGGALIDSGSKFRCLLEEGCLHGVASGNGGEIDVFARRVSIDGRLVVDSDGLPLRTGIVNFTGEGRGRATGDSGNINVTATESIQLLNGGLIDSSTFQTGNAGDVTVHARDILIDRGGRGIFTGIGSDTELAEGGGMAGNVNVLATGSLLLKNGGLISAATFGSGDAGNVVVKAGRIEISGIGIVDPSVVVSEAGIVAVTGEASKGNGGNVTVVADADLLVHHGGLIAAQALGTGKGGRVDVTAADIRLNSGTVNVLARSGGAGELNMAASGDLRIDGGLVSATASGQGDGGDIRLSAGRLWLAAGARVEAATTGSGSAGRIEMMGRTIEVAGGSVISSAATGSGEAGGVVLTGGRVSMSGSKAEVSAFSNNAGELRVSATGNVVLFNSLMSATAGGKGRGGDVVLSGRDVTIGGEVGRGDFGIAASTLAGSSGLGGSIRITAEEGLVVRGARVAAESLGSGGAGSLSLQAGKRIELREQSEVSARARGSGAGGTVDFAVSSGNLVVTEGSRISSSSDVSGDAGQVRLGASVLELRSGGLIESLSTGLGKAGGIVGRFDDVMIENGSIRVASSVTDAGSIDVQAVGGMKFQGGTVSATAGGVGRGGDVKLTANELSLASGTRVEATTTGSRAAGKIELKGKTIHVAGGSVISSAATGTGKAGGVVVTGGRVNLSGSRVEVSAASNNAGELRVESTGEVVFSNSLLSATAGGSGRGGDVVVTGRDVTIRGKVGGGESGIEASTLDGSSGRGGSVRIAADGGLVIDGARVAAESAGSGSAGLIELTGRKIDVVGGSVISSAATGTGKAGGLVITGGRVSLSGSMAEVSSLSNDAGDLKVASTGEVVFSNSLLSATAGGAGRGGDVVVTGRNVTLFGDGLIDWFGIAASTLEGSNGRGGKVEIGAEGTLAIDGARVAAESLGSGRAGSLVLDAGKRIVLKDQGEVSTRALGSGAGGSVKLTADVLRLESGARVEAATTGSGSAGLVRLSGRIIDVEGGSVISSQATGGGEAGGVMLAGGRVSLSGSSAEVSAVSNNAGELRVSSTGNVVLSNSLLSATAGGSGRGGDVLVTGRDVVIFGGGGVERYGIVASTLAGSSGRGGKVEIVADGNVVIQGALVEAATAGSGSAGRIELRGSKINVAGGSAISSAAMGGGKAGGVVLAGGQVSMSGSKAEVSAVSNNAGGLSVVSTGGLVLSNSLLAATAGGTGSGGGVVVSGRDVTIRGEVGGETHGIVASTLAGSSGLGGKVEITADGVLAIERARVAAESLGSGKAGSLTLQAGKRIEVRDQGEVSARAPGSGGGGSVDVTVSDGRLLVTDGSRISSSSDVSGKAGQVRLGASVLELRRGGLIESLSTGSGNAGGISGIFGDVIVSKGAIRVASSKTNAGNIELRAGGEMSIISGEVSATAGGNGEGGSIKLTADKLTLASGARAEATTTGSGLAGQIELKGRTIDVTGGSLVSSAATRSGNAGSVTLDGGKILLADQSTLSVLASQGNAGSVRVLADGDLRGDGVMISANAGNDGGNIELNSGGSIFLNHAKASADAGGSGGNIAFGGARHLVLNHTPVSASAVDRDGGNIFVSTGTFFANSSPLSVTSEQGAPGTIRIETLAVLDGALEQEEPELLNPDDVLQPSCSERAPDVGSSFTRGGKGATPRLPGGFVPSFRIVE